jgi:hypothetical protein
MDDVPPNDAEERIKKAVKAIMAKFPSVKK